MHAIAGSLVAVSCIALFLAAPRSIAAEDGPQNYAIKLEIRPPKPYTWESIAFIVKLRNVSKRVYAGAAVEWAIFEDGADTHTANGTVLTNRKGKAVVDFVKKTPGELAFRYSVDLPDGAKLGGEEEINVTDRSFRLRSSSSIFKVPFGTKQGRSPTLQLFSSIWDISRPQVLVEMGKELGEAAAHSMEKLRGMVSNALAAIIK